MSIDVIKDAIEHSTIKLSISEVAMLLVLAYYASPDGGNVYPSLRRIAKGCHTKDLRLVRDLIERLKERRILVFVRVGKWGTKEYRIDLDVLTGTVRRDPTIETSTHVSGVDQPSVGRGSRSVRRGPPDPLDPSIDPSSLSEREQQNAEKPKAEKPKTGATEFLAWFQTEYAKRRNGTVYVLNHRKHTDIVAGLLAHIEYGRLQKLASLMLSAKTNEPFIVDSDRGIEVLRQKVNWLNDRLSTWEAQNRKAEEDR
jgi:hypothetical protein